VCPRAERGQWFDQSRVRLKEERGGARKLLEQMKEAMDQRQPTGAARKALETSISYFENHLSKMNLRPGNMQSELSNICCWTNHCSSPTALISS
jgi:hypothetical protein